MKLYLAQINTTVGDYKGNYAKILEHVKRAEKENADMAVFPEMCLTGYPPMDLLNYSSFAQKSEDYMKKLAADIGDTAALIGYVEWEERAREGLRIFNCAALLHRGEVIFNQRKMLLPTYDVFDEKRYFEPGKGSRVFEFKGARLAITICEDVWNDRDFWEIPRYHVDPVELMMKEGADYLINISASPFTLDKIHLRSEILKSHCAKWKVPGVMVNSVGGNDELIFDGTSMVCNAGGEPVKVLKSFTEDSALIDLEKLPQPLHDYKFELSHAAQAHEALVLGVRDYFAKCGFKKALLGLSGGIDSALTACIAASAIGPENVLAVLMPSRYSSEGSVKDAEALVKNLGMDSRLVPIDGLYQAYLDTFEDEFKGLKMDTTEENFQARIRGNILMGFSNKYGQLLLTTGNKSEIAVGYCTLYGDMSGGLAVLSDVPKTLVYDISRYINKDREIIPVNIIEKAPSAELRPDQKDQDTLPPYELLDDILHLYVERELDLDEIVEKGFDREVTARIIKMVDINEYKRKQMTTGLKITGRAFGFGRRMPIAQKYHR